MEHPDRELLPIKYLSRPEGKWSTWKWESILPDFFNQQAPANAGFITYMLPDGGSVPIHALRFRDRRVWVCTSGWKGAIQRSSPRQRSIKSVRVTQYETEDGKRFGTHWEAQRHEILCRLNTLVPGMDKTDLLANADEVSKLLRKYITSNENVISRNLTGEPQ